MSQNPFGLPPASRPSPMAQMTAKIREFGWMVLGVFPTREGEDAPHAYTVGLTTAGLPELLMSGNLGQQLMQELLNAAARLHLEEEYGHGSMIDTIASVPFKAQLCDPGDAVQQAHNYYCDPDRTKGTVKVLQLVWPCEHGYFPGDKDYCRPPEDQPLYEVTGADVPR
jgi:hypothetical protein